jgi:transcriptional regulator with XRE-family HTH domain
MPKEQILLGIAGTVRITDLNSDATVLGELGRRVSTARLERNISQEQLAREAGVSRSTVWQLESGRSVSLSNFVRVLRALGLLEQLGTALPEELPRPVERLRSEGRRRQRASSLRARGRTTPPPPQGAWPWSTGGTT